MVCFDLAWLEEECQHYQLDAHVEKILFLYFFCGVQFFVLPNTASASDFPRLLILEETPSLENFAERVKTLYEIYRQPNGRIARPQLKPIPNTSSQEFAHRVKRSFDEIDRKKCTCFSRISSDEWNYFADAVRYTLRDGGAAFQSYRDFQRLADRLDAILGADREARESAFIIWHKFLDEMVKTTSPRLRIIYLTYRLGLVLKQFEYQPVLRKIESAKVTTSFSVPHLIMSTGTLDFMQDAFGGYARLKNIIQRRDIYLSHANNISLAFYLISETGTNPYLSSKLLIKASGKWLANLLAASLGSVDVRLRLLERICALSSPMRRLVTCAHQAQARRQLQDVIFEHLCFQYYDGWEKATRDFALAHYARLAYHKILWIGRVMTDCSQVHSDAAYHELLADLRVLIIRRAPYVLSGMGGHEYHYGREMALIPRSCHRAMQIVDNLCAPSEAKVQSIIALFRDPPLRQNFFRARDRGTSDFYEFLAKFLYNTDQALKQLRELGRSNRQSLGASKP